MNLPPLYGWNKTSEAGEDVFATSVFLGVCNYRCPYCMNSKIVPKKIKIPEKSWEPVWEHLAEHDVKIVHISGGEPTMTPVPELLALFSKINQSGCRVGMSTNGSQPDILRQITHRMDYVALDIKTDEERYTQAAQAWVEDPFLNVCISYEYFYGESKKRPEFEFEVRTTLFPAYVDEKAIRRIGEVVDRDVKWILQPFRHAKNMLSLTAYKVDPYTISEDEKLLEIAKEYCDNVEIKYV